MPDLMLEVEVLVDALVVLVVAATLVVVVLLALVLLGRADNPEWLARKDPQDRLDPKVRKDLRDYQEAVDREERTLTKDMEINRAEGETRTTPAKGKPKEGTSK